MLDALLDVLQTGMEGALIVAGLILSAIVSIYCVKHLAKTITSGRW